MEYKAVALIAMIFLTVGGLLIALANGPRDTTDPPGGRSGMRLYTDHATGLQYLGCVTPRMTADGRHMKESGQ